MIQTISTYHIQVRGTVDEDTFNIKSPLQITVIRVDPGATLFAVSTDQSGLIGLIRHLHGQSFVLISISRLADKSIFPKEEPTHE